MGVRAMRERHHVCALWSVIGCLLAGCVWSASAQQQYSELIGDWYGTGVPGCPPCQVSIQGVQDDGKLILRSSIAGDYVESWGEAKRDGDRIDVHLVSGCSPHSLWHKCCDSREFGALLEEGL